MRLSLGYAERKQCTLRKRNINERRLRILLAISQRFMAETDWDTVTYLRKKAPTASQTRSAKVSRAFRGAYARFRLPLGGERGSASGSGNRNEQKV